MLSVLLLIVLVAVGAGYAVVTTLRHRNPTTAEPRRPAAAHPALGAETAGPALAAAPNGGTPVRLAGWVAAGLITAEQSAAITRYEQAETAHPPGTVAAATRRMPAVAEALGYLGGALAVGGLVVLIGRTWPDLTTAGRLGLSGTAAVLLAAGGWLLRGVSRQVPRRLRVVLWLAGCAASAVFTATAVHDGWGVGRGVTVLLAAAAVVAVESGLLWRWRQGPTLQLAFLAAATVALGALAGHLDDPAGWIGLTVLAAGVAALAVGLRRWVSSPALTEGFGAFAALVGGTVTAGHWPVFGLPLLSLVGAALVGLALVPGWAPDETDQVTVGAIGAVTLAQAVPATLGYFTPHAGAATGLTTYALAAATVYLGARRRVRLGVLVEAAGAAMLLVGAAVTFDQWHGVAPILGALTAMVLIGLGVLPGQLVLSVLGSAGLLVNVAWAIDWFFPGRGRGPVLIVVCGLLIVAVAVLLGRLADRSQRSARQPGDPDPASAGEPERSPEAPPVRTR